MDTRGHDDEKRDKFDENLHLFAHSEHPRSGNNRYPQGVEQMTLNLWRSK